MPSKTRGKLSRGEYKRVLKNEAPETLRAPKRSSMNTESNFKKAEKKFSKLGNWATPSKETAKRFQMKSRKGGSTKKRGN